MISDHMPKELQGSKFKNQSWDFILTNDIAMIDSKEPNVRSLGLCKNYEECVGHGTSA